ncbi:MAG: hypothetical protein ACRDI2_03740, partial [Chloroflexota bacterium]
AGAGLGVLFALLSPLIAVDLRPLAESPLAVALFALGVGLTAGTVVLDQVLVGLLRGELQLGRNALFAAAKLGALLVVGFWVADRHGLTIFATWLAGILASLAVLAGIELRHRQALGVYRPEWGTLGRLGLRVLGHQALNLALQTPQLALPVVVTAVLSATMTAYFYVASMVAGLVYAIPVSLTAAIYAVGARAPSELAHRLRFSLKLSVLLSVLANGALLVIAEFVLSLFGHEYAERGAASLRILAIGVLPMIVKDHYVAICRVHGLVGRAAVLVATGGCIELILAAVGARWGGLTGLSLGWVAALALEAAMMAPTVYRAAAAAASASGGAGPMGDQERPERQPEWRMV